MGWVEDATREQVGGMGGYKGTSGWDGRRLLQGNNLLTEWAGGKKFELFSIFPYTISVIIVCILSKQAFIKIARIIHQCINFYLRRAAFFLDLFSIPREMSPLQLVPLVQPISVWMTWLC